jgi:hypothetical protein
MERVTASIVDITAVVRTAGMRRGALARTVVAGLVALALRHALAIVALETLRIVACPAGDIVAAGILDGPANVVPTGI